MSICKRCDVIVLAACVLVVGSWRDRASAAVGEPAAEPIAVKVSQGRFPDARINPMLFGNFIELLDDLVPGMWAEMLNDRGFEGVIPAANWVYYDGSPTWCDRAWNPDASWRIESQGAFNGGRCAALAQTGKGPAVLSQSGLSVSAGASYRFSAYVRALGSVQAEALLVFEQPVGAMMELGSLQLENLTERWSRVSGTLRAQGSTDRARFELRATGSGRLLVDQVSLMPVENDKGWRKDVVRAVKDVKPALIRWGGSVVDPGAYRWMAGIGDRDQRVPFKNANWGRIDSNDVGIAEFLEFCRLVGALPLVCVSFSDGAQSAADLVEFCNGAAELPWGARRAELGAREPFRVKYWQLGNELSGDDDAYIEKCKAFIRAMKKVDPSIAILSSFPSKKVLSELGKDLAYVAPHHYTHDLKGCEADFENLRRMIGATKGAEHVRLAVTEWNFTGGDWGLGRAKMLTLEGALWNARYLNLMCRHADVVEMACRSNLVNSYCSGIIGTTPGGLIKRPSYHVMKLYAENALPVPLGAEAASDALDVFACASPGLGEACVFAVNLGREPREIAIDFGPLGKSVRVKSALSVCDSLDRRQPDVVNQESGEGRVRTAAAAVDGAAVRLPAFSATAIRCDLR